MANALIPMGVQPFDLGNSLAKGVAIGNALLDAPIERQLKQAQAQYYNSPDARSRVYGTPIPYRKPDGSVGLGAIGKDGRFVDIDTPGEYLPGTQMLDLGDRTQPVNKYTAEPVRPAYQKSGDVPQGFQPADEGGYRPMAGTKQEADMAAEERKVQQQQQMTERTSDVVTEDIDRIKNMVTGATLPTTGFVGGVTQNIPGTAAHDVQNLLNTVKANIGFDKLQQMRQASPTGGALGPVSDFENKLLQSTFGALEQSQSQEQLFHNLDRLRDMYLDIVHGPGNRPGSQSPLSPPQTSAPPPASNINARELEILRQARDAIAAGADQNAVLERLRQMGINVQ